MAQSSSAARFFSAKHGLTGLTRIPATATTSLGANEMANRAMLAKIDRAKAQRIEAGNQEFGKCAYIGTRAQHDAMRALVQACNVQVNIIPAGYAMYGRNTFAPRSGVCSRQLWK